MRVQDFLAHHGIQRNPFAEEEAQTDPVFKEHCIDSTYHPTWDKVFGDPKEPATSIVFGEKGAGKTAMRLQIAKQIEAYNRDNAKRRIALVHYDDFNPFLDRFASRFPQRRKPQKVLDRFQLWDHMDAILSIATTGLVDSLLQTHHTHSHLSLDVPGHAAADLDRHQSRDLLLLASIYDASSSETQRGRWHRLRRATNYWGISAFWDTAVGFVWTFLVAAILTGLYKTKVVTHFDPLWLYILLFVVGWLPKVWRIGQTWSIAHRIHRQVRVGKVAVNSLRRSLSWIAPGDLNGQPLPMYPRTEDRYELFGKLMSLLEALGYDGMIVVIDRVDEPHLVNGAVKRMKAIVWPLLDNKFLKQPGIGFKLMLPAELRPFVDREEPEFHQRARLDKQNVIASFEWTGEALVDLTNARIQACALEGQQPNLRRLVEESVSDQRLLESMRTLRVPRHLFKFLYRAIVAHCNAYTTEDPRWTISSDMFESQLAVYLRDREAMQSGGE